MGWSVLHCVVDPSPITSKVNVENHYRVTFQSFPANTRIISSGIHICLHICAYIYMNVYVYMCVCDIYVYLFDAHMMCDRCLTII